MLSISWLHAVNYTDQSDKLYQSVSHGLGLSGHTLCGIEIPDPRDMSYDLTVSENPIDCVRCLRSLGIDVRDKIDKTSVTEDSPHEQARLSHLGRK